MNVNVDYIEAIAKELIAKNQFLCGLLRISISRGIGGQGYQPPLEASNTIVIETIKHEISNINHSNDLWFSAFKKIPASCINPNIKLMSGTQSILAKIEALQYNCCESLLLDEYDNICEGASSNIFWIKNNIIFTPAKTNPIYQGSIREAILNLFPNTKEVNAPLASLNDAEEIFLTNTAWKIKSISCIKNLSVKVFDSHYTNQIVGKLKEDINEKTRHLNAWQL